MDLLFTYMPALVIWTAFALLMLLTLRLNRKGNPLLNYHLSTATLIALPAGLLFVPFLSLPAPVQSLTGVNFWLNTISLPEISIIAGETAASPATAEAASRSSLPVSVPLLLTGLLAAAGLLRLSFIYYKLRKSLRHASPVVDSDLLSEAEQLRSRLGITRNVRLLTSADTAIPFTTGLFRPMIVLPENTLQESDSQQRRLILTHEMVHIARSDFAAHFGELLVRHLFWVHPFVHVLYRQAAYYREVSCDSDVLRLNSGSQAAYAEMLYRFALLEQEKPQLRAAMAEEHKLLRRIRNLDFNPHPNHTTTPMKTMKNSILTSALLLLLITGLMACSDLLTDTDASRTEVNLDESITYMGQTITLGELREQIANNRQNLLTLIEENTSDTDPETLQIIQHTADEMGNVLMLIDNGHANRAIAAIESLPPPPPPALNEGDSPDLFTVVEQMPEMIGGQMAFYSALRYPEMARQAGIEGRVILQFIVDEQGNVTNPTVVRSAGAGGLDEAALEALSQVRFKPGMQRGRAVKVQMTQPVVFRFSRSEDTSS
ncbi:TonB family C-terminal domain-containing protein [Cyclonatronum proteinivorum]|uniref:TonB family C-terminal domain-containing protein n=1 Tax=Cyclonatronum proteinivorum TaxID=1457365 RepID=A0A345UPQ4_9BACT|nr:TonB family C-terminal domain-containing protein [Cyclonatronum proteinivorum]